jgi:hypothetical protein
MLQQAALELATDVYSNKPTEGYIIMIPLLMIMTANRFLIMMLMFIVTRY